MSVQLAAARSLLWEIIALAEQVPVLTDEQLRFRLRALAVRAAPGQPEPTIPGCPPVERPPVSPGGQPVPECGRRRR